MITIVGGGLAGLSAAIRARELGAKCTLIEGACYPAHRVCGEFFSPECLPILERWGLLPDWEIRKVRCHLGEKKIDFDLPSPARTASHYTFDLKMADYARSVGVDLQMGRRVESLDDLEGTVIVGTGRVGAKAPKRFPYRGFKAHFKGIDLHDRLEMHFFEGGYYGMNQVDGEICNIACITKKNRPPKIDGEQLFDWMEVRVPPFGPRAIDERPNTYYIGDAAGAIPPIAGDGIAMGITSGVMAAEYAIAKNAPAYRIAWKKRYGPRLRIACWLHQAMVHRSSKALVFGACRRWPQLTYGLFRATRERKQRKRWETSTSV